MRYLWILALASCASAACLPMEEVAALVEMDLAFNVPAFKRAHVTDMAQVPAKDHGRKSALLFLCAEMQ